MYISSEYASPVGRLTLAAAGGAITGLWIEGQKYSQAEDRCDVSYAVLIGI